MYQTQVFKDSSSTNAALSNKNDHWTIDVTSAVKVPVPSFIRLFVINRVLHNENFVLNDLVNNIADKQQPARAENVLSQLTKNGIKKYMCDDFETEQQSIIEIIFNQIIMKTYKEKYHIVTNDPGNMSDDEYYQRLVFNTNDLMCLIFEFLRWDCIPDKMFDCEPELESCCLVNSYWMYHVWNTKPGRGNPVDLSELIDKTDNLNINPSKNKNHREMHKLTRMWQHVINANSVYIYNDFYSTFKKPSDLLLSKISMLENITDISGSICLKLLPVLKVLVTNCGKKIKCWQLDIQSDTLIQPLHLINVQVISVRNMFLYYIWTNKCQTLILDKLENVNNQWIKFIIDNCDCSGIEKLVLNEITFKSVFKKYDDELLLKQFAQKFTGLKSLFIKQEPNSINKHLLCIWKHLHDIIDKNKTRVRLETDLFGKENQKRLIRMIKKNNTSINQLDLWFRNYSRGKIDIDTMKTLIINCDLECLTIDNWETEGIYLKTVLKCLQQINQNDHDSANVIMQQPEQHVQGQLESLEMIAICNNEDRAKINIDVLNDLFSLDLIVKRKLFIKINLYVGISEIHDLGKKFEQICKNICQLLIKYQIPLSINITFRWFHQSLDTIKPIFQTIYSSFFDETNIIKQYKEPLRNKYCQPLLMPKLLFEWTTTRCVFCVVTAEQVNDCIILPR